MWCIEYYETENGKMPAYDFINSLPTNLKAKAAVDLGLLEELGSQIKLPYSRPTKNGLHELRINQGGDAARVFYFFFVGEKIILLNGFLKKTQKTPAGEIEKALKYKADYERRCV